MKHVSTPSAGDDLLGKTITELGAVAVSADGSASGTLNKVSGFSAFSSDTSQQSGYYLAFKYDGEEEMQFNVKGAKAVCDKSDHLNIAFMGADKAAAEAAKLNLYVGEESVSIPMTGVTFNGE